MAASVAQALNWARGQGVARLDAQLLLAGALQHERSWLIAHDDAPVAAGPLRTFETDVRQRAAGVPLAYLTGEREFHGLMLHVAPGVLVPRPETEGLVDWALARLAALHDVPVPRIIDLGTGSGAIALAIKRAHPSAEITATDLSPAALHIAGHNAQAHRLVITLRSGSWWSAAGVEAFHLALSNPPYIAGDDPHLAALAHEPRAALTPEGDGLAALHQIIDGAPAHLRRGAWLLLEHGHDQAAAVRQRLHARGFIEIQTHTDLSGLPRCSGGCWPGQTAPNIGASR